MARVRCASRWPLASRPRKAARSRCDRQSMSSPWTLVALLWTAAFLNSAGRQILITVLPQIRAEFGLSATQLALINSVGFWIYAVSALVFGRLGDATHRSRLIAVGLAFWAVATGMVSV